MFVCCKAAEETCELIGSCLCPANRPSPLFTLWTWILNIIILIIVIVHFSGDSGLACTSNTKTWNGVIIAICCVNMMFAIYIYARFTQKIQAGEAAGKAANQLFMYDFGVYFYMWFIVFQIIWIAIRASYNDELVCTSLASTGAITSLIVLFLVGGFFVVILSLFTECCRQPKWAGERQYQAAPQHAGHPGRVNAAPPAAAPVYAKPIHNTVPQHNYSQQPAPVNPLPPQGQAPPASNPAYGQPSPYGQPQHGQQGAYTNQQQQGAYGQQQGQQQQQQQQQKPGIMGKMNNAVHKIF